MSCVMISAELRSGSARAYGVMKLVQNVLDFIANYQPCII